MFLSYVTIWYPLGFRLNTMYGEKSSMIVQGLPHACGGVSAFNWRKDGSAESSPRMWGCFHIFPDELTGIQVFPTHVGVFPPSRSSTGRQSSLPHACGGVSGSGLSGEIESPSSPRMWGCFLCMTFNLTSRVVFPTHVGVFPCGVSSCCGGRRLPHACGGVSARRPSCASPKSLPHACGGVSPLYGSSTTVMPSSPRMWGCFYVTASHIIVSLVFPTHVGVFPQTELAIVLRSSLPHACGGVSKKRVSPSWCAPSSPRMWGCFRGIGQKARRNFVFPTHVGVFLRPLDCSESCASLPHACGGVSSSSRRVVRMVWSSPRMWGCFQYAKELCAEVWVFPTHVGVFPSSSTSRSGAMCLPHACGGVSTADFPAMMMDESSPRMWGCFWRTAPIENVMPVFPTHVGAIFKPYNLPTPRLPCSRPYPARTAGRAGPANAGFGKALSNHPATGNPPRRSCGKSGAWAAWLQALPVPAFRAGVEASLPAWAARRALLPLRPAPHVGR